MDSSLLIARILYIIVVIIFIFSIAVFISSIISYFVIDITNYTVESSKLPKSFDGFRILQLSDLHNMSLGKNNSRILKKIEKEKPDIIVMTGDMINTNSENYDTFYEFAGKIAKNYDTYYIMGNHELRLKGKKQLELMAKLRSLGITVLDNETAEIKKNDEIINIYGLHEPITTYKNLLKNTTPTEFSLENMKQLLPEIDESRFNILLSHSPFNFKVFSDWRADLILSGHIHGGLVRLPIIGGILSPERTFFPKYSAGKFTLNNSTMIVSRGLGNGTINLRVFNNPEICIIELKTKKTI